MAIKGTHFNYNTTVMQRQYTPCCNKCSSKDDWVWKEMCAPSFGRAAHGGLAYGTRQVYIEFICDVYIFESKFWSKLFFDKLNEN